MQNPEDCCGRWRPSSYPLAKWPNQKPTVLSKTYQDSDFRTKIGSSGSQTWERRGVEGEGSVEGEKGEDGRGKEEDKESGKWREGGGREQRNNAF